MTATAESSAARPARLPFLRRWFRRIVVGALASMMLLAALVAWRIITWPRPTAAVTWAGEVEGNSCQLISEVFFPPGNSGEQRRLPAIVLLHGIDGPTRYRWSYYATANELRNEGYAVFLVHYFGAVDYADLWHFKPDHTLDHEAIEQRRLRDQRKWVGAVTCAIQQISQRDDIDPTRIAIDGYSLGGFTSLSAVQAALTDPQTPDVRCVVCNWGAMFRGEQFTPGFPPTLLVHGELDDIVEIKHAHTTCAALEAVDTNVQLCEVPGAGHRASSAESKRLTREFFARHLQP